MENKDTKTLELIRESIKIHGEGKYDYTDTIFINKNKKFKLKCINGHNFETTYRGHIKEKYNCLECSRINNSKKKLEEHAKEFESKSKNIHGNRYDYSKVEYRGVLEPVTIICGDHKFIITPNMHLSGQGCKFCNEKLIKEGKPSLNVKVERKNEIWTTESFIEKAKKIPNNNYDYSLVNVKSINEKITIICKEGHVYQQGIYEHLEGMNCKICESNKMTKIRCLTTEQFIENSKRIFGLHKFNYSKTIYINTNTKLTLICNEKNHEFKKKPSRHYSSLGCPYCVNKSEAILYEYLKIININIIYQFYLKQIEQIKKNPFDFCIEELKLIIELDGRQHFEYVSKFKQSVEDRQKSDFIKMMHALNNGYSIIRIYQPDFARKKNIDWMQILKNNIKKYNTPTIIYLSDNDSAYNIYKNNFEVFKENNTEHLESIELNFENEDYEEENNEEENNEDYEEENNEEENNEEENNEDYEEENEKDNNEKYNNNNNENIKYKNIFENNDDCDDNISEVSEVYLSDYIVDDD